MCNNLLKKENLLERLFSTIIQKPVKVSYFLIKLWRMNYCFWVQASTQLNRENSQCLFSHIIPLSKSITKSLNNLKDDHLIQTS